MQDLMKIGRVDKMLVTIFLASLLPNLVMPFYLPGIAPKSFCSSSTTNPKTEGCDSAIDVLVNRLDSFETVIPYDYHKFDFCEAPKVRSAFSKPCGMGLKQSDIKEEYFINRLSNFFVSKTAPSKSMIERPIVRA